VRVPQERRVAPGVHQLALPSRTLPPFDATWVTLLVADGRAALIDPGFADPGDADVLVAWARERGARDLDRVFLTHTHGDHVAGLPALLERAAAAGWPMAVVTNAMRPNAEAMLGAIGARAFFEIIVIGEECPRGKPDPYPYAHAMELLGVAPDAAVAFEDSPSGLRSAAAAGARTIGVRSGLEDAALRSHGAHATIADFEDPALEQELRRFKGEPA